MAAHNQNFFVGRRHNTRSAFVRELPLLPENARKRPTRLTSDLAAHTAYLWEMVNFGAHLVMKMRDVMLNQFVVLGVLGPQLRSDLRHWLQEVEAREEEMRAYWRRASLFTNILQTQTDEHWGYIMYDYQRTEPHYQETRDLVRMFARYWIYAEWEWDTITFHQQRCRHNRQNRIAPPPSPKFPSLDVGVPGNQAGGLEPPLQDARMSRPTEQPIIRGFGRGRRLDAGLAALDLSAVMDLSAVTEENMRRSERELEASNADNARLREELAMLRHSERVTLREQRARREEAEEEAALVPAQRL
jgi:hypothetical protein